MGKDKSKKDKGRWDANDTLGVATLATAATLFGTGGALLGRDAAMSIAESQQPSPVEGQLEPGVGSEAAIHSAEVKGAIGGGLAGAAIPVLAVGGMALAEKRRRKKKDQEPTAEPQRG